MHPPAHIFEHIVSKPRLDSYRGYWKVGADAAVGLYMWNGEVCAEVSKLLCHFEISLRNNIHRALSLSTSAGASPSVHWWDTLSVQLKPTTRQKVADVRNDAPHVLSPDEIVSRLSFGFWPNVLNWLAKQQPALMPKILPAHSLSQVGAAPNWWNAAARQNVLRDIFELKEVRNRIAHHEPLWKFSDVLDTSPRPPAPPILICPASIDEATTIRRFARLLQLYDQAVASLSPALHGYIRASSWRAKLDFLLSSRGVQRYKDGLHVAEPTAISPIDLGAQFAHVLQRNRPVRLLDASGEGIFFPV